MTLFKGEKITDDQRKGQNSMWVCLRGSGETLETVATSQAVSTRALLFLRLASLVVLVLGALWITSRSGEPPLCLPDWSYLASSAYFAVRGNQLTHVRSVFTGALLAGFVFKLAVVWPAFCWWPRIPSAV